MYRQITVDERYTLGLLRQLGYPVATIARVLGRDRSTVWREVRRNRATISRHDIGMWSARAGASIGEGCRPGAAP